MVSNIWRIASTAKPSAPFLSPLPIKRPQATAAASVTRTNSIDNSLSITYTTPCEIFLIPLFIMTLSNYLRNSKST